MNHEASNCRIHLTRWVVTALAEKHSSSNHHPGLPGPRRPQPAGDANVRCVSYSAPPFPDRGALKSRQATTNQNHPQRGLSSFRAQSARRAGFLTVLLACASFGGCGLRTVCKVGTGAHVTQECLSLRIRAGQEIWVDSTSRDRQSGYYLGVRDFDGQPTLVLGRYSPLQASGFDSSRIRTDHIRQVLRHREAPSYLAITAMGGIVLAGAILIATQGS